MKSTKNKKKKKLSRVEYEKHIFKYPSKIIFPHRKSHTEDIITRFREVPFTNIYMQLHDDWSSLIWNF